MEEFVTYDLAKKLKEKGFPQKTFGTYDMVGATYLNDGRFYKDGCIYHKEDAYTAPIISEVLKWLREENKIFVEISPVYIDITFYVSVYKSKDGKFLKCYISDLKYNSYEQAALAGIDYVLDNLI